MPGARPRWGLHQLRPDWAALLVEDAGISPGDLVLDVGAGFGAITQPLVASGARVVAIELHAGRAAALRARFADERVTVVRTDAGDLRLPRNGFRVVSNPPFAVSVALLRRLLAPGSRLVRADIVVPWHTAERWTSPGAPGAGRWAAQFEVRTGRPLPRGAFLPAAPARVAVLVITRRGAGSEVDRRAGTPRERSRGSTARRRRRR